MNKSLNLTILLILGHAGAAAAETRPLDCLIEPHQEVELSSAVTGIVEEVLVERGDTVAAGQVVLRLESGVEQAAVALARARAEQEDDIRAREAQLAFAKRRLERHEQLYRTKVVSFEQRDEAQTDAVLAEMELRQARTRQRIERLELAQAEAALARRVLKSPIDGVVVERLVAPGESVEDRPLLHLARIDPLNVEVIAPVALFGTIRPGMAAEVSAEQPIGGRHRARVVIVDRVLDGASGTFGVRLELPNPDYAIPAGLHCQVRFLLDRDQAS
ncbi:MAG: efflux RND transporter periplasmic adaptor subunit [Candidatus Competibacteraceae bacterium]|nr:efflux RND transporter periplasmic adaptor subunit [Candidatus Competibacteraceae bacterium]